MHSVRSFRPSAQWLTSSSRPSRTSRIVNGGDNLNPGKIILGVLTVIGLLADLIDDD